MQDLEEHTVKYVNTFYIESRYTRTIWGNARIRYHGRGLKSQCRAIVTDKGAIGWGLSTGSDEKNHSIIGRKVSELFHPDHGVIVEEALYLDFALHDLAGVILEMPVHKMISTSSKRLVPCYDGAIYMDDIEPENEPRGIELIIKNCSDDYALGFRDFKLKVGRGFQWLELTKGIQQDIKVIRAVRENFPNARIMLDANDGYTLDDMIRLLDQVSDCDIFWIEEPFRENRENLAQLKEFLSFKSPDTLTADGEGGWNIDLLLELSRENLIDVLQMDIVGFGFTSWRKIIPILKENGALASPHTWGDPLKVIYAAHLAAGLDNIITVEGIPSIVYGVDTSHYKLENGFMHVPEDVPGFGLKLTQPLE